MANQYNFEFPSNLDLIHRAVASTEWIYEENTDADTPLKTVLGLALNGGSPIGDFSLGDSKNLEDIGNLFKTGLESNALGNKFGEILDQTPSKPQILLITEYRPVQIQIMSDKPGFEDTNTQILQEMPYKAILAFLPARDVELPGGYNANSLMSNVILYEPSSEEKSKIVAWGSIDFGHGVSKDEALISVTGLKSLENQICKAIYDCIPENIGLSREYQIEQKEVFI